MESPVLVIIEKADDFGKGIGEAFVRLAEKLDNKGQKRDCYGIVLKEDGGMNYYAAYTELYSGEANEKSFVDSWLLTGDAGCALMFADLPGLSQMFKDAAVANNPKLFFAQYPNVEANDFEMLHHHKKAKLLDRMFVQYPIFQHQPLFFIKGRIKDILICKGQNIPCDVIEAGALSHAAVFEAVAVPIADLEDGEVPAMVVTLHADAQVNAKTLLSHLRNREVLPRLYWPVMLAVVNALPKTPTGKYQRIRAREIFTGKTPPAPFTTEKYGVEVQDIAVANEYDLKRKAN